VDFFRKVKFMSISSLPSLDSEYPLTQGQIDQYQRDGHILLRGLCSPQEIAAFQPIIGTTTGRYNKETRELKERDTYGRAFLQVTNLWQRDPDVARFVLARRFAQVAARLMQVPGVRLYHDQALYKEPGGGPTPWHQDQFYWPMETDRSITMWMPLVDVPVEKGALTFASGSHTEGSVCPLALSDESEKVIQELVDSRDFPIAVEPMNAGDATFHSGWTLHRAPGNQTDSLREIMTVIYYPDGTVCSQPRDKFQQLDLDTFFPGRKPGEPADTELNPLVYRK
jgi:ectoine hydroxylase-related dioxygenase (phytanoyl-CoA dioxygenase family)